jgi:hypothetical protein
VAKFTALVRLCAAPRAPEDGRQRQVSAAQQLCHLLRLLVPLWRQLRIVADVVGIRVPVGVAHH